MIVLARNFLFWAIAAALVSTPTQAAPLISRSDPAVTIFEFRVLAQDGVEPAIEVDYIFDGTVALKIGALALRNEGDVPYDMDSKPLKAGRNRVRLDLRRKNTPFAHETTRIGIYVFAEAPTTPVLQHIGDWSLSWSALAGHEHLEQLTPEKRHGKMLIAATELIDQRRGGSERFKLAEDHLRKILVENPNYVMAYVELARVRTNGGSGGDERAQLQQAEQLLDTALKIDPLHTDALVLQGWVYGQQQRLAEAIAVLDKAEKIGSDNLWLPFNRGLAHEKAGDLPAAIAAYEAGTLLPFQPSDPYTNPRLHSHNRAIPQLFGRLIRLLDKTQDWKRLEAAHRRRIEKVPTDFCAKTAYAQFRLDRRGEFATAISDLEADLEFCDRAPGALALAYLLKAHSMGVAANEQAVALVRKASALEPDAATTIYRASRYAATFAAIKPLLRQGVSLDVADTQGRSALFVAVENSDHEAAGRLLTMNADPNAGSSMLRATAISLAVMKADLAMAKLLLNSGADPTRRLEGGESALSLARLLGNAELQKLLESNRKL